MEAMDRYRDRAYMARDMGGPPDRFGPRYDWPEYDARRPEPLYERGPRLGSPLPRQAPQEDNRPAIGSTVPAGVTSIKGHLGIFVEIMAGRGGKLSGLIHLSEISPEFEEVQKRVRSSGRTDRAAFDAVDKLLERHFKVGQQLRPRVVKYKKDRGMSVVDLTLLSTVDEPRGVDISDFGLPDVAADGAGAPAGRKDGKSGSQTRTVPSANGQDTAPRNGSTSGTNTRADGGSGTGRSTDSTPAKSERPTSAAAGSAHQPAAASERTGTGGKPQLLDKKEGKMEGRKHGAKIPDIHTIHKVTILKAFHDGIFVSIPGYDVDGLVHHSQISRNLMLPADMPKAERYHKINDLIGDIDYDVYVKTVYVCDEKDYIKCECSLKMVSQRDGRDLDTDHRMWYDYMIKRRARGAGTYTAPKMRDELKRVAFTLGETLPAPSPDEVRGSRTGDRRERGPPFRGGGGGGHHGGREHHHEPAYRGAPPREPEPYHDPYRGPHRGPDPGMDPHHDPRGYHPEPRGGPPGHYDGPHHPYHEPPPRDPYYGRPYSANSDYTGYAERPRTHDGYVGGPRDPYYDRQRDGPPPPGPRDPYHGGGNSGYGGAPDPYAREPRMERPPSASMHTSGRPLPRDDYERPAPAQPEPQYAAMRVPPPDMHAGEPAFGDRSGYGRSEYSYGSGPGGAQRQPSPREAYPRSGRGEAVGSPHVELGDAEVARRAAQAAHSAWQPAPMQPAPEPAPAPAPAPVVQPAPQPTGGVPAVNSEAFQAMINNMVAQQTEAKVAEVLAEERRKRKMRSRDREPSDDVRKRRHRRSTESR